MRIAAYILGAIGLLFTVKPFIKRSDWFIRIGDFPRLQILLVLFAALVLVGLGFDVRFLPDYLVAAMIFAAIGHQFYTIIPFTPFSRKEVQAAREASERESNVSLLIFNVLMENDRFADAVKMIRSRDADIVLLAEPDSRWNEAITELSEIYPHKFAHPLDNRYGMILLSRLELNETAIEFLIQDDIPSIHTRVRLRNGSEIALHGVHPRPPVPGESSRSTERDGELLIVGKAVRESDLPCIVAGDLNDVAWSRTTKLFKRVSGLLDPRVGRGFFNTFHAAHPFLRLPLDHVFHSSEFRLVRIERINDACGSDHFPVFIELSLESDASVEQPRPVADPIETEEARDMIGAALARNRRGRMSLFKLKSVIARLKERISRRR